MANYFYLVISQPCGVEYGEVDVKAFYTENEAIDYEYKCFAEYFGMDVNNREAIDIHKDDFYASLCRDADYTSIYIQKIELPLK